MKRISIRYVFYVLFLFCVWNSNGIPVWLYNADVQPERELYARSAILMESATHSILFEKEADVIYPIASLSKLMTLHIALQEVDAGNFSLEELVDLPERAHSKNQMPGSSLMFLSAGQKPRVLDLLYGLMVSSGNDAATALAIILAGSVAHFVERMNHTAQEIGLQHTSFADPAGLHSNNRANSREIALLAIDLISRWPELVRKLASTQYFTYPTEDSLMSDAPKHAITEPITQKNRNRLLWEYEGAEGLKTGYTEEAKYALVASARRAGRELIVVLLSVRGENHDVGSRQRTADAINLFDFGFQNFTTRVLEVEAVQAYIPGGLPRRVALQGERQQLTLFRSDFKQLSYRIDPLPRLAPPIMQNTDLAVARYFLGGQEVVRIPLSTAEPIQKANLFQRTLDAIRWGNRKETILQLPQ